MNRIRARKFFTKKAMGLTKQKTINILADDVSLHTFYWACCSIVLLIGFVLCSPLNFLDTLLRKDPILCYQCDFLEQNLVLPTLSMGLGTLEHWYRLEVKCDFLISCILASHLLHHPANCKRCSKAEHSPSFLYLKPCTKKCTVSNIKSFNTLAATESLWYY